MRKIPDENLDNLENYFSDSSYKSNINRDSSSSSEDAKRKAATIGFSRKGKKSERSTSVEGRRSPDTPEKYTTMTLNRAGRKRNKYSTGAGFVRLTRRDALVPQSENGSIGGDKLPSFLDENYNHEPSKKGHTL